ncbi:MBL fold metallo-hydrolase [Scatolibacter rhodanostii]|uniref:MBL fold metallo-hydrolase n=1 Tax=Scatolibacter rhodanostii TaxID=2014781 RepID=UPI000C086C79|nr:MBL fold metallo-hydrolase [Scatolibacter rhodanostii]
MEKKIFFAAVPKMRYGFDMDHPWKYTVPFYRAAPHVWQVGGQDDVCVYLLDTGEGIILLDTGYQGSFYLLMDNIWRAGFDPKDIKHILLSHWHWDHVNGARYLKEMSGAKIWISKEDEKEHQAFKDATEPMSTVEYEVDCFYDNSKTIDLGRFKIHTKLCAGHTPGSTSFFFEDTDDETGVVYKCAMHGGLGAPLMRPDLLAEYNQPQELAHRFIRESFENANIPVDIMLPSHLNQGNVMPNIPEDRTDYTPFIADYAWGDILRNRAEAVMSYYPEVYPPKN